MCTVKVYILLCEREEKKYNMEALYHQTHKMLQDVQNQLGYLERANTPEANHHLDVELQARIDQIVSNCERLELLVNKEPPSRRTTAKLRVDQLKYDCQHLQAAKRNVQHRRFIYYISCRYLKDTICRSLVSTV